MPIKHELDKEINILRTTASGILTTKDIIITLTDRLTKKVVSPGQVSIIDIDAVEDLVVSYSDLA